MSTTYTAAIDEMFATVEAELTGYAQTLMGYALDVRWPGAPLGTKPDRTKLWARVSAQNVTEDIAALANDQHNNLYQTVGMLYIQLFAPRNVGASIDKARLVAQDLRAQFRKKSTSGEIEYYKAKLVELPETEESYPITVSVQYLFRTISAVA